ncbi:MAG: DNA gyrase subunit A [Clostridia bacterium]|nr:DNA gyrase subunit A [Clostridia bacterium]
MAENENNANVNNEPVSRDEAIANQVIHEVDIVKEMRQAFLAYSMSVITSRALPDVRDGLKPVHRRILYSMHENGLTSDKKFLKSATTVGDVIGKYHPHGDASVYDALVRLAQPFSLRYTLVDGHGNFGSIDGDPPAAYRYTEARLGKIAAEMLADIGKETVDMVPTFDDQNKEPAVLPARFPNLLVNGAMGIAVGMATNIPPHNLGETIDAAIALIDDPDIDLPGLMEHLKGPDFPGGGIIMGRAGIRAAYATGRGKIVVRARCEIEEEKSGSFRIIATELPYLVNKAELLKSIAELVKDKRIEEIRNLRDESDRNGLRIVIELKRDANPQVVLNRLYSYTRLQDNFSVNMLALSHGEPKLLTLKEVLHEYVRHQEDVVTRRTRYDLRKAEERAHILEGLKTAIDFIDEVVEILKKAASIPEGKAALMERFGLDDIQATAIVQMRLGQLTGMEKSKIEAELNDLYGKIAEFRAILSDEGKVLALVKTELAAVRDKYGDARRTEISAVTGEVDIEDLIPVEECAVTLTHYGYIKRMPVDTYQAQHRGGRGVNGMTRREEDFVKQMFVAGSHDYILFFTNMGLVYRLKGYEIPEGGRASKGMNIVNILPLQPDEKVSAMIRITNYEDDKYLCMITKGGTVKRTALSAYNTRRSGGLKAILLDEGDELSDVMLTDGTARLFVSTRDGKVITFDESTLRALGRVSRGVRGIRLEGDDSVVGMQAVREDALILTVTENGFAKRTALSEYRKQARGGKGMFGYKLTERTGKVAGVSAVEEDDDLLIINSNGVIIRMAANEIPVYGRVTQGVKAMRIGDDNRVVTLSTAKREEDEGEEGEAEVEGDAPADASPVQGEVSSEE